MISAELLKKAGYHANSIHCSYYGLFQKMKYTIKTHLKLSKEDYDNQSEISDMTSHRFLITLIKKEAIKKGADRRDVEKITNNIVSLKSLRETADYEDIQINSDDSDGAYQMSTNLMRDLKTIFKI
jgi:uncharacterized protein (UPF0332 family)